MGRLTFRLLVLEQLLRVPAHLDGNPTLLEVPHDLEQIDLVQSSTHPLDHLPDEQHFPGRRDLSRRSARRGRLPSIAQLDQAGEDEQHLLEVDGVLALEARSESEEVRPELRLGEHELREGERLRVDREDGVDQVCRVVET
jgi:hypothetical protein